MIGVFDSGVGGLTVLRELRRAMPRADFLYFGDTLHAPYGVRPHYEIVQLTVAAFLIMEEYGATGIVSACNSVSAAMALADMGTFPLPQERLVEMVGPTVEALAGERGRILLAATEATVRAGIYQDGFAARGIAIDTAVVPELAGAIERGASAEEVHTIIERAIAPHAGAYDTLVLGCTHYPLVMDSFRAVVGNGVRVFDPAAAVAAATAARIPDEAAGQGTMRFLVSRETPVFRSSVAARFTGEHAIEVVE